MRTARVLQHWEKTVCLLKLSMWFFIEIGRSASALRQNCVHLGAFNVVLRWKQHGFLNTETKLCVCLSCQRSSPWEWHVCFSTETKLCACLSFQRDSSDDMSASTLTLNCEHVGAFSVVLHWEDHDCFSTETKLCACLSFQRVVLHWERHECLYQHWH